MSIKYSKLAPKRCNASWNGDPILMDLLTSISIQGIMEAGSTANGTFTLECSNNGTNWESMTGSGGTTISKAVTTTDTFLWDVLGTAVKWLRVKYTSSSGDGYVDLYLNAKEQV